jgi:hypothetical protein
MGKQGHVPLKRTPINLHQPLHHRASSHDCRVAGVVGVLQHYCRVFVGADMSDTPRTDAACEAMVKSKSVCRDLMEMTTLACDLERELAAAKSEIERLGKIIDADAQTFLLHAKRYMGERDQLTSELSAAKAEIERLCKINDSDSMTFERGMARIIAGLRRMPSQKRKPV